jgi:putative transposase
LIEAYWRSLKHSWLYLNTLDSYSARRRLTEFYVKAHNGRGEGGAFE